MGYALARIQQTCAAVEIIIEFFVLGVEKIHNGINKENISIFPWAGVDSWNLPWAFSLLSIKYESDHFFLLAYFFL